MIFSDVKNIQIPEGSVKQISCNGVVLWQKTADALQLLNPYTVPDDNKFINRVNGGLTIPSATGGTWRHSDYIEVEENTAYLFGAIHSTASTAGLAWYDEDKVFISGISNTNVRNANGIVTSPTGARYIRVSWRIDEDYNPDWEHTIWFCENGVCDHWTPWIETWYEQLDGITFGAESWFVTDFYISGDDTLDFTYTATVNCNIIGAYTSSSAQNNYSFYHSSSGAYARYNGSLNRPAVSHRTITNVVMSPNSLTINNSTTNPWTAKSFTATTPMWIGMLPNSTATSFRGSIIGEIVVPGKFRAIPCRRKADGVIGYYEVYSDNFYENQGSGSVSEYTDE